MRQLRQGLGQLPASGWSKTEVLDSRSSGDGNAGKVSGYVAEQNFQQTEFYREIDHGLVGMSHLSLLRVR